MGGMRNRSGSSQLLAQLPCGLDEKLCGWINRAVFQRNDANAAQGNMQVNWNSF
jgi:hypothetical protein